jgi:hypothetical protein
MENLKRRRVQELERCVGNILTYCKYVNRKSWETRRCTKLVYKALGLTCIEIGTYSNTRRLRILCLASILSSKYDYYDYYDRQSVRLYDRVRFRLFNHDLVLDLLLKG